MFHGQTVKGLKTVGEVAKCKVSLTLHLCFNCNNSKEPGAGLICLCTLCWNLVILMVTLHLKERKDFFSLTVYLKSKHYILIAIPL